MRNALVLMALVAAAASAAAQPAKPAAKPTSAPAAKPAVPAPAAPAAKRPAAPAAKTPVLHIVTAKGTIVVETYPSDAPRSFEHILKLVKRHFYDGQAVHRVVAGQLVQFGDPQTRNMMLVDNWGRGPGSGSGEAIGVVELSKAHKHLRGTLALAHPGTPAYADSQLFIVLRPMPIWDGKYTIIGQVTSGIAVADKLARGDKITSITVTGAP
jgi:peptidyl-prolyl cis-trans isomerase B (cyclophilin B)